MDKVFYLLWKNNLLCTDLYNARKELALWGTEKCRKRVESLEQELAENKAQLVPAS